MNIFERASRNGLRLTSSRGNLTTEQLWDIPLTAKGKLSLDEVARTANIELKALSDDSFVNVTPAPGLATATLRLDIVKHIIAVKQAQIITNETRAAAESKRKVLLNALARKKDSAVDAMTIEEIEAELASI